MPLCCPIKRGVEAGGRLADVVLEQVDVRVECEARRMMAEPLLHLLGVLPGPEEVRGAGMAERVKRVAHGTPALTAAGL